MNSVKSEMNGSEQQLECEKQRAKINEVRALLGLVPERLFYFTSDASIARYLRPRNWNVMKATKMLKETLKWRLEYKPEEITWDEIANEAETGKIYRSNFFDKHGRSVLVMRPGHQNTKSIKGQIRYLVYCMENAILNLPPDQEQMVWLVDFHGYMSHISLKLSKETVDVLQKHYPERLGVVFLYNPPRIFESFFWVIKPFLEPKTASIVHFVYSNDPGSMKVLEECFNIDELDCAFGGKNSIGFNLDDYAARMREDDSKMHSFWSRENNTSSSEQLTSTISKLNISESELDSNHTEGKNDNTSVIPRPNSIPENGIVRKDVNVNSI